MVLKDFVKPRKSNSIYPTPQDTRSVDSFASIKRALKDFFIKLIVLIILISLAGLTWVYRNSIVDYYKIAKDKTLAVGRDLFNKNVTIPTPTPVSTADWQTFNNEKYRYRVKYPNNWVYYQWKSLVYSLDETYRETIGFGRGPKTDTETGIGGDIRISIFAQGLEKAVKDVKDHTSNISSDPSKLLEEINVNISGIRYRKLTFSRFVPEPPGYNPEDRQLFYFTSHGEFSYVISYGPFPAHQAIDEEILASFEPY